jgi:integrase
MGLYRRGPTWWISFTYNGQQVRQSTETDDRKLAEKIYHKVMTEVVEGKWFERQQGTHTFAETMERYMKEHSVRNKTPKSHERDKSLLAHLLSHFGTLRLSELCPRIVSEYKVQRRAAGVKPKTINNELALMNHALNLCVKEWEWLKVNPIGKVSKEKVNNRIDRWLLTDEEKRLRDASRAWLWEIILFAMSTGLRQGDIINLRWNQVDLRRRTLYISAEQKNKDINTLPLNATAMGVLEARSLVHQIPEGYVFLNRDGGKINARNLLRSFYAACDKAKVIKFRFHDLRHTFATRLVQAGVDLYTVQKLGRWKSISMVERYAHHCPESLRPGVEALDRIITNLSQSPATDIKKGQEISPNPLVLFGCGGKI